MAEVKRSLNTFVNNELFGTGSVPKKSNKRFHPRVETIRSAMKRIQRKIRKNLIDQDFLEEKIKVFFLHFFRWKDRKKIVKNRKMGGGVII